MLGTLMESVKNILICHYLGRSREFLRLNAVLQVFGAFLKFLVLSNQGVGLQGFPPFLLKRCMAYVDPKHGHEETKNLFGHCVLVIQERGESLLR